MVVSLGFPKVCAFTMIFFSLCKKEKQILDFKIFSDPGGQGNQQIYVNGCPIALSFRYK